MANLNGFDEEERRKTKIESENECDEQAAN